MQHMKSSLVHVPIRKKYEIMRTLKSFSSRYYESHGKTPS